MLSITVARSRITEDEVDHIIVNQASVGSLSLKRRSAGLLVLDILNRKKNTRVAAVLVSGLLSDSDVSDHVDESENEKEDDNADNVKDDVLETVGYVFS